jgi:uncharacterized repeat protein (TIGR03843 family)
VKAGPSPPEAVDLIARGEMKLLGLMPRASNYTFLAEVSEGERRVRVVYKPRDGEAPLWDFPHGTLCRREVAAYLLAQGLGWPPVPLTMLREGPHGEGAVQLFVDSDAAEHFFTLREERADDFRRFAAFDVLANNADRKSGHCLLAPDGTIWAIDHGVCFSLQATLRTVIWDFAGKPMPLEVLEDVQRVAGELRSGALREQMLTHLAEEEVDATAERAESLTESARFPMPGPGRAHPWPPV